MKQYSVEVLLFRITVQIASKLENGIDTQIQFQKLGPWL